MREGAFCPICRESCDPENARMSILPCAHMYCTDCITRLVGDRPTIVCPTCRARCRTADIKNAAGIIKDVTTASKPASDPVPAPTPSPPPETSSIQLVGTYGTKVNAIVRLAIEIRQSWLSANASSSNAAPPKILIFSLWNDVLGIISNALVRNQVSHIWAKGSKIAADVSRFKSDASILALCLPIKRAGKGLNLIEANHVFLVEPILNIGMTAQAVGRVHRIGQTRETTVHRFVVSGTIEEAIHRITASSSAADGRSAWQQKQKRYWRERAHLGGAAVDFHCCKQ